MQKEIKEKYLALQKKYNQKWIQTGVRTWTKNYKTRVKGTFIYEKDKNFSGWKEGEDGMQHTSREMFVIPLIKAVQELSTEVKELKAKLEDK